MTLVASFDRRTLRERCTAFVRGRIVSGDLAPGERLVEAALSLELGVSRGTLRESLRPLEAEGLLVPDGRGHTSVRKLSSQEVLEVFEVRSLIETFAATKLAERSDRSEIAAELRRALAPLREPNLEFAKQIEIDIAFHARLCELTGHTTLIASWSQLIGQIEMVIIAAGPSKASDRMRYDEHEVLVAAIETGDPARVQAVFGEHMDAFSTKYVTDARALERD